MQMSPDEIIQHLLKGDRKALARAITLVENEDPRSFQILKAVYSHGREIPVIGITGPAGVGKSSLVDCLISVFRSKGSKVGVVAVDPSSPFSGGAILGDRIRMQRHGTDPGVFIRSMATRGKMGGISAATFDVVDLMNAAGMDLVIVETVGVGQDEVDVMKIVQTTIVVLMPGLGDEVQAMKAGLMEIADLMVINKSDRPEAQKMEAELTGILSFFDLPKGWKPKILKTVAVKNEGIEELVSSIMEHGDFLRSSGMLNDRIRMQNKQRLVDALEYRILSYLVEEGFERFGIEKRIQQIGERKVDPYTVVREILKHFHLE